MSLSMRHCADTKLCDKHVDKIHPNVSAIAAAADSAPTVPRSGQPHLHAVLPADEEVSAGEEAGHGVARQVVDPALAPQLGHDGINEGVAGARLRPRLQRRPVPSGQRRPGTLRHDPYMTALVSSSLVGSRI